MTETKERVIAALKDILVTTRYPKVTVNELCLRARISRNTFYANFEDKDDVIRLVFESSVLQPIRDLNRLLDLSDLEPLMERMNEQMYERLAAEGEFFKNLIGPIFGKDDTFLRIATQAIYQLNMELIPKTTRLADDWHTDYIAYFFASSQAMLMQHAEGGRKPPWPSPPSMPVQLTLPRKDTSRTLRCDDRALTAAFQMGRTGEARGDEDVQGYNEHMFFVPFPKAESDSL